MSKSARINFGLPESEYIVQVNDSGEAVSCYNQDTETEYIGGGGGGGGDDFIEATMTLNVINGDTGFGLILINEDEGQLLGYIKDSGILYYSPDSFSLPEGTNTVNINIARGQSIIVIDIIGEVTSISGDITVEDGAYFVSGDCTINIDATSI